MVVPAIVAFHVPIAVFIGSEGRHVASLLVYGAMVVLGASVALDRSATNLVRSVVARWLRHMGAVTEP